MSKIAAFVGPTIGMDIKRKYETKLDFYPPAEAGDIIALLHRGYKTIILIDGYYYTRPSPWHKEILYGLKSGVTIVGCSSLGAIRSSELDEYGMIGHGKIALEYMTQERYKDSDVAVLHLSAEHEYINTTIPVVDLEEIISTNLKYYDKSEQKMLEKLKEKLKGYNFHERNYFKCAEILKDFSIIKETIKNYFKKQYKGQKERDAIETIEAVVQNKIKIHSANIEYSLSDITTKSFTSIYAESNFSIKTELVHRNSNYNQCTKDVLIVSHLLKYMYLRHWNFGSDESLTFNNTTREDSDNTNRAKIDPKSIIYMITNLIDLIERNDNLELDKNNIMNEGYIIAELFKDFGKFSISKQCERIDWIEIASKYLHKPFTISRDYTKSNPVK